MNPIKNRAFNRPRTSNGAEPDHWTITNVGGSWGTGKTWASGVYRAVNAGPFPEFGDRCLLLGPADSSVSTDVGSELDASDSSSVSQVAAGAAFRGAVHLRVDAWIADVGADKGNTQLQLKITDGTTIVTNTHSFTSDSDGTRVTLSRSLSTLDTSKDWTISVILQRTASTSTGVANAIPRVYISRLYALWGVHAASPPRILKNSENLVPSSTISSSSEASGYTDDNVANGRAGAPWVSSTGATAWIEFDLGSAQDVNFCALVGMNLDEGDTITLTGGTTSAPSDVSYTIPTNNLEDAFVEFSYESYRYWRLSFSGTSKQWQVGEIVLGMAEHMQRGYHWGAAQDRVYGNTQLVTAYGQTWTYQKYVQRSFVMSWGDIDLEDAEELLAIIDDAKGDALPLTIVPDPAGYDVYFGHFAGGQFSKAERSLRARTMGQLTFRQQAKAVVQS